jgi:hypothetical protein
MPAQRKPSEDVRRLLKPGEVKLHKVPPWLTKRLHVYRKAHALSRLPSSLILEETIPIIDSGRWLDHWGTSNVGPFACCHKSLNFVSEPYEFGAREAKTLDRFCGALGGGLQWHVSSNTWWYPGHTVRITIHEMQSV